MYKGRALILVVGFLFLSAGCSTTGSFTKRSKNLRGLDLHGHSLPRFDVPIEINDRVRSWLDYFQGVDRARFERYLERSGRYVEWMRTILKEERVPQDLVYLALIESGFSNHAYSRAKAMGPWQFIKTTGRLYGLDRNTWLDERRDPEKATRAAAQYLRKLYNDFGDWYLAMAAYNAGEGRVANAIRAAHSRDFWEISAAGTRYLRAETKDYVPKFIAATLIAKIPGRFGFRDVSYHDPIAYDEIKVDGPLDLTVAAELIGVNGEEMARLNPELSLLITPPHPYYLKVPVGSKVEFELAYAKLPVEQRTMIVTHKVKRGETLSRVAKRYGVRSKTIMAANDLKGKHPRLKVGQLLVIPKGKVARTYVSRDSLLAYNKKGKRVRTNGVEWLIKQEQMKNKEEKEATDAAEDIAPQPASMEAVEESKSRQETWATPPPRIEETDLMERKEARSKKQEAEMKTTKSTSQTTHVVKRGENLWLIAKRYKVRMTDLKQWNNLTNGKLLRPGKKLVVSKEEEVVEEEVTSDLTEVGAPTNLNGEGVATPESVQAASP